MSWCWLSFPRSRCMGMCWWRLCIIWWRVWWMNRWSCQKWPTKRRTKILATFGSTTKSSCNSEESITHLRLQPGWESFWEFLLTSSSASSKPPPVLMKCCSTTCISRTTRRPKWPNWNVWKCSFVRVPDKKSTTCSSPWNSAAKPTPKPKPFTLKSMSRTWCLKDWAGSRTLLTFWKSFKTNDSFVSNN